MGAQSARLANEHEAFTAGSGVTPYLFRLYVAGSNLKSTQAVQIVRELCALFPRGRCKLEVIDLYQQPEMARADNILAVPSLVKVEPLPRRAFIGITEDVPRILNKLGIPVTPYVRRKAKIR